jgi:uncharacterized protein (DUF2164 family)
VPVALPGTLAQCASGALGDCCKTIIVFASQANPSTPAMKIVRPFGLAFFVYNKYMLRKWDIENKELHRKCADEVITRIQDIDDPMSVGVIAAEDIIDIVLTNLGPEIYNKAINDTNKLIQTKLQDIDAEIEMLKQ